ncbi:hypothetical protein V5O48_016707 [Marasmius crinis-equi]|uniref:SWIM-type domain-containing protein n=1 Tax=Marasmius crinis-equi TaxID=585013 RepID=A0ABR3EQZ0_9AGAR
MLTEAWHHLLKGYFIEGKRNRWCDHLIYTCTKIAIPHFISHQHRQEAEFEGLNLCEERKAEAEAKGLEIAQSEVTEMDSAAKLYSVQSQTSAGLRYAVDLSKEECQCPSFPSIKFCKHLYAVKTYFRASPSTPEASPISIPTSPASSFSELANIDPDLHPREPMLFYVAEDHGQELKLKLNALMARLEVENVQTGSDSLSVFSAAVDQFMGSLGLSAAALLLPKQKIAPNQHSWTETATTMGLKPKKAAKRTHTDAFSGGEKSGKLAKPDAKHFPIPLSESHTESSRLEPASNAQGTATSTSIPLKCPFEASKIDLNNTHALQELSRNELRERPSATFNPKGTTQDCHKMA